MLAELGVFPWGPPSPGGVTWHLRHGAEEPARCPGTSGESVAELPWPSVPQPRDSGAWLLPLHRLPSHAACPREPAGRWCHAGTGGQAQGWGRGHLRSHPRGSLQGVARTGPVLGPGMEGQQGLSARQPVGAGLPCPSPWRPGCPLLPRASWPCLGVTQGPWGRSRGRGPGEKGKDAPTAGTCRRTWEPPGASPGGRRSLRHQAAAASETVKYGHN